MAAKLTDVARRAGVSPTTASRVLNNKMAMPIPQHTVDRIRHAAQDLRYVPNRLARGLAARRSYTLGFYTHEMTDPHGAVLLDVIEAAARERGYYVLVSARVESVAGAASVDGVVALRPPAASEELSGLECPVVSIYHSRSPVENTIGWSDFDAGRTAARHLAELGHRRLAGIYGSDAGDKGPGLSAGAEEAGLELVAYQEAPGRLPGRTRAEYNAFFLNSGYQLTRRMLSERPDLTAIFARNDVVAAGVLQALREAAISVPQQMSVLSYYDTLIAACTVPPLTSVRTPIEEAGRLAVGRLIDAIEGGETRFAGVHLPTSLIIRQSTGPAPVS